MELMNTRWRTCTNRFAARAWFGSFGRGAAVLMGLLVVAGCAAAPVPPSNALRAAEQAIGNAERERVADYASAELAEAREMLVAARDAVDREDMVMAQRLAEQSRVDAELASAIAGAAKAQAINTEMQTSTRILEHEMQRNTGERR